MITVEEFTKQLIAEFEDIDPNSVTPETNYREIKNWSSMYALIVIAFIDTNFDVTLNADDMKNSQTIRDLYNIITSKTK